MRAVARHQHRQSSSNESTLAATPNCRQWFTTTIGRFRDDFHAGEVATSSA
jgi:hypothetical protein